MAGGVSGTAASRPDIERSPFNRRTVAAYIRDRAGHLYNQGDGEYDAFYRLARDIEQGEVEDAFKHGELDDLLPKARRSL